MRGSPLCDGAAFTRHLEAAYRDMWQRWVHGIP
jgi:predicted O-linked N-acetylglucosamine transferase (SPINDLY family)